MSDPKDDFVEEEKRPGSPVDRYRVYLFFKRYRYWLLLSLALSGLSGVFLARALIPYEYQAACTLMANPSGPESTRSVEIQAEADSVKLSSNLDEVRRRLGIGLQTELFSKLIRVHFDIQRSNLLLIQASWGSPELAAKVANTVAETFIEYEKRQALAERQQQIKKLQADLEAAAARLANHRQVYSTLRKEKGVSDITIETRLAVEEAAKLRFEADKGAEEAKRIRTISSSADVRSSGGDFSVESKEIAALRYDLAQARARLATVSARLPPEHPTVKAIEQEVKALEKKLPQQINRSRGSNVRETLEKVLVSQSKAEAAAAQAEQRVRQLADNENEMTVILTDIQVAERHVEDLKVKLTIARDSSRETATAFRILTPAQPPPYPEKSQRKVLAMAVSTGLAGLTLAVFLLTALRGLRVFTSTELAFWTNCPVVGSSVWPRDADALTALIRDLDDLFPSATGSTMVVSLDDTENELSAEVARRLTSSAREDCSASAAPKSSSSGGAVSNIGPTGNKKREVFPWTGENRGPALRRAARLADRVLVLVRSGTTSAFELARLTTLLGRRQGVGVLLLDIDSAFIKLPDRVGDAEQFWKSTRQSSG